MQKEFKEIYGQAVTESLSVLGQQIANLIISYAYEKYSIRLSETSDNPKALTEALKSTLDGGTRIIQRRIIRLLYNKIEIEPQFSLTINFEEKVLKAKKEFEQKNHRIQEGKND
jgi:hypothetical protein